ncbi:MAG: penicillin-binding protein activator [Dokdonella sp.]
MPSIRLFRWIFAACLLATAGCVTLPTFTPVDAQGAADAEAMYRQGELERSAVAFLNLASRSGSDDAAHFRLRAAEARRDNGDLKGAAMALDGIKRRRLPGDEPFRLDLLDAEIALDRGDAQFAESRIRDMDADAYPSLRLRALELRARAQAASSRPLAAARTRSLMDGLLQGIDRDRNRDALLAVLATIPAAEREQRAKELPQNDALWPWLNQSTSATSQFPGDGALRPLSPVGNLVGSPASGSRVALLLPTTGAIASVAAAIRDGFFTAYFADPNEQRPQVTVYDTGRTPDDALAAYGRAVGDGADRVVGPLQREAVGRLFGQPLPVRLLALNHPDSGAAPPPGSAEFGLPPDEEGTQAADRMLARGIRSSAIITGDAEWAERASQAFRARFEQGGGRISGQARLRRDEVNYRDAIRAATSNMDAAPADSAAATSGIFISMLPQQARLLVPQLNIANVKAPVFATSHVYAGERNVGLDRDLDGVEFSDAPWLLGPMLGKPDRDEIVNQISSANASGARLFALGMDAYNLLGVIDALLANPGQYAEGATGQLTADRQGRIFRTLAWGQFENGVARPSLGALTSQSAQP